MENNVIYELRRNINKRRMLVIRPLPVILIFFVLGLVAWFFWYRYIVWIYVGLASILLLFGFFGVFDKRLIIACIVAIVLSFEGFLYLYSFNRTDYIESGYYTGTGVVESISNSGQIIVGDVVLEGRKLNGNILIDDIDAKVGDYIGFGGTLTTFEITDTYQLHRIAKGVYYELDVDLFQYEFTSYKSPRNEMVSFIKDAFIKTTDNDTANYLMSIMFGESEYLDYDIKSSFTAIGVAHVFAVSGLHIGVLSSVLTFICKKLRVPAKATPFVLIPVFGFYAYLCNFSPSVLRASIMFLLASFLTNYRACPDKISIWCFSALVSLIFKPVWLGDMSFLLSYGAVLGAYLIYPIMKRPLESLGKFKKTGEALMLNLSITISLIPMGAYFFSSFSPMAIAGSFFIIPLTSVAYVLTFICIPISALTLLVKPFAIAARYIVLLSSYIANTLSRPGLSLNLTFSEGGLPFWYSALVIFSDYCSLSYLKKGLLCTCLIALAFIV